MAEKKQTFQGEVNEAEKGTGTIPTVEKAAIAQAKSEAKDAGEEKPQSLVDILYDEINEVIGGDNADQYFCMTFPATLISPHSYSYDYKNNSAKPPRVEVNESRLANKLFDPCQVTGADNGRSLAQMYASALDILTPKLNAKVQQTKNELRNMLMMPYPYDFGNGVENTLTFQQVFYRLYDQWVKLKKEWAKLQVDKMSELKKKYSGDTEDSNEKIQDEYFTWYQTVAEGYLEGLNEQYGKILAVFSPGDMRVIEGILDSGSGAELQEARAALNNIRKANPNGGYTYPVTFSPENWFELLDTSFTGVDLLESPEQLSEKMFMLSNQKIRLQAQMTQISNAIKDADIDEKRGAVEKAQKAVDDKQSALISQYGEGIKPVLNAALSIASVIGVGGVSVQILSRLVSKAGLKGNVNPDDKTLLDALVKALGDTYDAQQALTSAGQALAAAEEAYIEAKGLAELKEILDPIKAQADILDNEIGRLETKIALSNSIKNSSADSGSEKGDEQGGADVAPNQIPHGFTQLVLRADSSSMKTATSKSTSAATSSFGASFFFGGGNHSESSDRSAFDSFTQSDKCTVEIGMSVAKVSIERDWFNPGLFVLTRDMCRLSSEQIAPAGADREFTQKRFDEMSKCVFPCYPTAFVVARDVTIKFTTEQSISQQTARVMEQHASSGGGFLFFSARKASSSSSAESTASVSNTDKTLTIRFTDPQILGYYMETVPADQSVYIGETERYGEYVTILDFVEKCRSILENHVERMAETEKI